MSKSNRRQRELARHPDRILTYDQFAALCSISTATLARSIARGDGPPVVKLSPRRLGIRESDGAAWQAARVQERA
jgi:predicted DNA-binding transcriptional regulator AlpA